MDRHTDTVKTTPPKKSQTRSYLYDSDTYIDIKNLFLSNLHQISFSFIKFYCEYLFIYHSTSHSPPPPQPHAHTQGKIPEHVGDVRLQVEG